MAEEQPAERSDASKPWFARVVKNAGAPLSIASPEALLDWLRSFGKQPRQQVGRAYLEIMWSLAAKGWTWVELTGRFATGYEDGLRFNGGFWARGDLYSLCFTWRPTNIDCHVLLMPRGEFSEELPGTESNEYLVGKYFRDVGQMIDELIKLR